MESTSAFPLSNSASSFFPLVSSTLLEEWKSHREPFPIKPEDLNVVIGIVANMAFEAVSAFEKELQEYKDSETKSSYQITSSSVEPSSIDKLKELLLEAEQKKSRQIYHPIFGYQLKTTDERIKNYVKMYEYPILKICQSGLPFSQLYYPAIENAVKSEIKEYDSFILKYMKLVGVDCDTEEAVNKSFEKDFQSLELQSICDTCWQLKEHYLKKDDFEAGFYLLWFIKKVAGCRYEIPNKSTFNKSTVANILTNFIHSNGTHSNSIRLLCLLLFNPNRFMGFLITNFLDNAAENKLLNFAVSQLQSIDFATWPSKCDILINLLQNLSIENKINVAKALYLSQDAKTKSIGEHLALAFKATNLKTAIPHFYALENLHFDKSDITFLFRRPFEHFRHWYHQKIDPDFARGLIFNETQKVFVHKSIMMGVYRHGGAFSCYEPYLLAYDLTTEKLLWGFPLSVNPIEESSVNNSVHFENIRREGNLEYHLSQLGKYITIHFSGANQILFINAETGEICSEVVLPETPVNKLDAFHISPSGYAYQMICKENNQFLIGGYLTDGLIEEIERKNNSHSEDTVQGQSMCSRFFNAFGLALSQPQASKVSHETKNQSNTNQISFDSEEIPKLVWKTTFFHNAPGSQFIPLSTHCGFESFLFKSKLVIFGPTGAQVTINNCIDVLAYEGKLFSLELPVIEEGEAKESATHRNSKKSDKVYLVIRSLLEDHQVISLPERRIEIHSKNHINSFSLKAICENNQVLLFGSRIDNYPIFVDLATEQIIYSDHKFACYSKYYINTKTAELWTWDEVYKQVFKVSPQEIQALGKLDYLTSFLHTNQSGYIYYC